MEKIAVLAALALGLGGCAVASAGVAVASAGVSVAATAVDVTTDVAGGAVRTVTGSGDDEKKDKN